MLHQIVRQQLGLLGVPDQGGMKITQSRCSMPKRTISRVRPCDNGPSAE